MSLIRSSILLLIVTVVSVVTRVLTGLAIISAAVTLFFVELQDRSKKNGRQ